MATPSLRLRGLLLVLLLLVPLGACSDFLDINDDPNNASPEDVESEPGLLFVTATASFATNKTVEIVEQSSFAQLWSATNGASVFTNPELYSISTFTTGNTWDQIYTDVNQNLSFIIETAEAADPPRPNVAAQARILRAYGFLYLTQLFEDIPFAQANDAEQFPRPAFDVQEDVLRGVIAEVDTALGQIAPNGLPGITREDVFFGGDMARWRKFGNGVKFKAYMLLRSGGADVDAAIGALLAEPLPQTNADNVEFPYTNNAGNENSFWQVLQDFSDGLNIWYDCAEPLVETLQDLSDPRLPVYCDPNQNGEFVGVPVGEFASFVSPDVSSISLNIIRPDFPERFMTAAEILLLAAEWHAEQGGLGTADTRFREGVRASLDWFDNQPGDIDEAAKQTYLASFPSLSTMTQAEAIETIQLQQWIDLFERRPEAWTHWRRTKVPQLQAPDNAELADIIRRYGYPPDPVARNPNTPTSKQGDVPMWFEGSN